MRPRRLLISSCLATSSTLKPSMNDIHNLLHLRDVLFRQIDNIDSLFSIFSAQDFSSFVEKIIKLSTVNFIETEIELKSLISF